MVPAFYESINGTYEVRDIELVEVEQDLQTVQNYLTSIGDSLTDPVSYEAAMLESIYQDMAKAVYKGTVRVGFVYFRLDDNFPNRLVGSSIFIPDDMIAFLLLGFFHRPKGTKAKPYHRILMFPHGNNIKNFRSLCTGPSLRLYNSGVTNFVLFNIIDRFKLFNKLRKTMKVRRIK